MNPVVHFQLPYENKKRMMEFYNRTFGWQSQEMAPEMGGYVSVTTTQVDPKTQRPKMPGAINGGFFEKMEDKYSQMPNVVIAVNEINEVLKKVEVAGGKINSQPIEIPGVGMYATFIDTEGNHMVLLEPRGM